MNRGSLDDLKEVLATSPTEARYSWVVNRNGTKSFEGTRVFHRREDRDRNLTSPRSSMRRHNPFHFENNNGEKIIHSPSESIQGSPSQRRRDFTLSPRSSIHKNVYENNNEEERNRLHSSKGLHEGSPLQRRRNITTSSLSANENTQEIDYVEETSGRHFSKDLFQDSSSQKEANLTSPRHSTNGNYHEEEPIRLVSPAGSYEGSPSLRVRNLTSPRLSMNRNGSESNKNEGNQRSPSQREGNSRSSSSRNNPIESDNIENYIERRSIGSFHETPPHVFVKQVSQEEALDSTKDQITSSNYNNKGNWNESNVLLTRPPLPKRVSFSETDEMIEGLTQNIPSRIRKSSFSTEENIEENAKETNNESKNQGENNQENTHRKLVSPLMPEASPPNSYRYNKENNREDVLSKSEKEGVAPRAFGDRYNLTKGHVKSFRNSVNPLSRLAGNSSHDLVTEYQYKNSRLQEELNSSNKKIQKLNKINENALKRKEELQQEVLDAYKKISDLEIERNSMTNQQRQTENEIKTMKQRLGDAEREAANAIGKCSRLERTLHDTETKKNKYFEDLAHAERRISKLENLLKEIDEEHKNETEERNELHRKLYEATSSLKFVMNQNEALKTKQESNEKESKIFEEKLNKETFEKQTLDAKTSELLKTNTKLKEDIKRLEFKYETTQRNLDQSSAKVNAQKERSDLASADKLNIESELREMQRQLSKEKLRRQKLNTEYKIKTERLTDLKSTREEIQRKNDNLEKENRTLKDKVLYFELYQQINENKERPPIKLPNQRGNVLDKSTSNRNHYLLDTLKDIKTKRNQQQTTFSLSNFEHIGDENKYDKKSFEKSRRSHVRSHLSRKQSGSSLHTTTTPELEDINAKIERIQNEQKFLNHVTTRSITGSSRNPSCVTTTREHITPMSTTRVNVNSIAAQEEEEEDAITPPSDGDELDEFSSNLPSFGDELKSEDEVEVENMVNFSDLLHDDNNKDLASALM